MRRFCASLVAIAGGVLAALILTSDSIVRRLAAITVGGTVAAYAARRRSPRPRPERSLLGQAAVALIHATWGRPRPPSVVPTGPASHR